MLDHPQPAPGHRAVQGVEPRPDLEEDDGGAVEDPRLHRHALGRPHSEQEADEADHVGRHEIENCAEVCYLENILNTSRSVVIENLLLFRSFCI